MCGDETGLHSTGRINFVVLVVIRFVKGVTESPRAASLIQEDDDVLLSRLIR